MLVIMKKRLNKKNYFKKFFETKNVENKEAKVKDKRKADIRTHRSERSGKNDRFQYAHGRISPYRRRFFPLRRIAQRASSGSNKSQRHCKNISEHPSFQQYDGRPQRHGRTFKSARIQMLSF